MKHVHEWVEVESPRGDSETWGCECGDFSDICHVCSGPSGGSLWICEQCLRREETVLDDIVRLVSQWDERDRHREKSPMAPRLVLARGGGESVEIEDVMDELGAWRQMWVARSGMGVGGVIDDLKHLLRWAVHNDHLSGWDEYRRCVRKNKSQMQAIVGLSPDPVAHRCMYCGARVVQDRCDSRGRVHADGRQDEVRCTGCGVVWDDLAAFQIVVRQEIRDLPTTAPDGLVTLDQARRIWPDVKRNTINQAIKRDRDRAAKDADHALAFPQLGRARDGSPLYRIRDLEVVARGK